MPSATGITFIHTTFFTATRQSIHFILGSNMPRPRQNLKSITATAVALLATFHTDSKLVAGANFAVNHTGKLLHHK
jgi:hypothetical protein